MDTATPAGGAEGVPIREQLRVGALAHVREQGTQDLTVRTLAKAAGRSTMCVYSKFGGRDALLDTVFDDAAAELHASLDTASPVAYLTSLRRWARDNPGLWQLLVTHEAGDAGSVGRRRPDLLCRLQRELAGLLGGPARTRPQRAVAHLCAVTGWLLIEQYAADEAPGVSPSLMEDSWRSVLAAVG